MRCSSTQAQVIYVDSVELSLINHDQYQTNLKQHQQNSIGSSVLNSRGSGSGNSGIAKTSFSNKQTSSLAINNVLELRWLRQAITIAAATITLIISLI